jgi:putative addiction module component (TIGR02574 family)
MSKSLLAQVAKLSVSERIELVEAIWDTVVDEPEALPLPDSHREELDRRLEDLERDPDAGSSWDEVRARLEKIC